MQGLILAAGMGKRLKELTQENTKCMVYDRRMLFSARQHVFEDAQFPVPRDADGILTAVYGDWRQVPPPEKRPRHARIIDAFHSACDL